jgi:heat shock protein HtpX
VPASFAAFCRFPFALSLFCNFLAASTNPIPPNHLQPTNDSRKAVFRVFRDFHSVPVKRELCSDWNIVRKVFQPEPPCIAPPGVTSNKVTSNLVEPTMGNTFKTAFLLTALTLLLMFFGRYFGGQNGMMLALAFAAVMNFVAYFFSDKIALSMYRAQPVTREQLPRAYQIVERLTQKIGIPMPKIYVIPTESPNAFATGRNPSHASVAVTHGILGLLNDEELEGVLAHELGHVGNRDILISSVAATIAGAITMLAHMGRFAMIFGGGGGRDRRGGGLTALFMLIMAPIAATLIRLAVSRSREYQADATGAHFTGNPYALASALQKLDTYSRRMPMQATPSTAHLFIIQPLLGGVNFGNLFSTHPPIAKRIERLTGRPAEFQQ